jgi:hypothetical protein
VAAPVTAVLVTVAVIPLMAMVGVGTAGWRVGRWAVGADVNRPTENVERTRRRAAPSRRWPSTRQLGETARRLVEQAIEKGRDLPPPVGVYAGRYRGAIVWRPDVGTFAAYLTRTTENGEHREAWVGDHPAQYPTVESLTEALAARGLGLDSTSADLARSYQQAVWDRIGSCTVVGTRLDDGSHRLTIHNPHGQTLQISPADRDDRSAAFGPPADLAWGSTGPGALETARCLLEYTNSTTRDPRELFDDARSLAITAIRDWPPDVAIDVADLHHWTHTRHRLTHRQVDPTVMAAQAAAQAPVDRPSRQRLTPDLPLDGPYDQEPVPDQGPVDRPGFNRSDPERVRSDVPPHPPQHTMRRRPPNRTITRSGASHR